MTYEIRWHPAALREFKRFPRRDQQRIASRVGRLAGDPRPAGSERLIGVDDGWRLRVGTYRVLYQVRGDAAMILVARVARRGEAYVHLRSLRQRLRWPEPP